MLFGFFLCCFPPLFFFLPTAFPIPQRSHYGETELLINCFPKGSLQVATLLTSQTSPRTDWRLLVFPHGHQGWQEGTRCLRSTGTIQTPQPQSALGTGLIKQESTMRQQFSFPCALLLLLHMIFKEHYGILCT